MAELYASALSKAQEFNDDSADSMEAFNGVVALPVYEQADVFALRFAAQFQAAGGDAKEFCKKVTAVADMWTEKLKSSGGKTLKFGGVEFGDVYKEFAGEDATFMERKKKFSSLDFNGDGTLDVSEFLLYLFKDDVLKGYEARNASKPENEGEALVAELSSRALFVDAKLDEAVLGLKQLKENFEKESAEMKENAKSGVQKVQLANNLKNLENKYEEDQKGFLSKDQIGKKVAKVTKGAEALVKKVKKEIAEEAEAERGPTKKK